MHIRVLFFGQLRDLLGKAEEQLELPAGGTLQSVFDYFAARVPRLRDLEGSIVLARNQEFESRTAKLADGDEVALLPPVSGGSTAASPYTHEIRDDVSGNFFALTRQPIDSPALARQQLLGQDGALITFEGVVRNNTKGRATQFLDYECYEAMAIKVMAQLGREIAAQYAISRITMVHRLGRMEISEASVVIVITAPHRKPAYEASLEAINRLKRLVPIWKKEHFADGEVWVEGEWDDAVAPR